jgi:hypothetical protein
MALIECPECSGLVSNLAESCPKCGANQDLARERRRRKRELERRARLTKPERWKEDLMLVYLGYLPAALILIIVGWFIYSL